MAQADATGFLVQGVFHAKPLHHIESLHHMRTSLHCAFRARQLGQRAIAKQVEGNVVGRDALESAIADIGTRASDAGFTTAQACRQLLHAAGRLPCVC
jgi:hypothetical protein